MGVLYVLTLIIMGIAFMMFKKSDEKLNFIKWLIIFLVSLFGYNIVIGMVLGLLNITSYIWLLSIINLIVSFSLGFKAIKNKDFQKYTVRKIDIFCLCIILIIFLVMFFKDLYILNGNVSHAAIDSAIHYRAARHYAEYLKIFINVEDKSFFNFNVMQPGAYINDGIFMNIMHRTFGTNYVYLYQWFETMVLFLSGLAFYSIFIDRIKTKRGAAISLILFGLYIYGYPYNAWFYGFSYLAVGIMMVAILVTIVELLYSKENVNKSLVITLIGLAGTGLIFSYCLFVPAIYSAICIYCFIEDLKSGEKRYIKIFGKNTLIVTSMLLLITCAGIGYLFIPTFFIAGQTDLVSALKIDGAIYSDRYHNFLPYVPFAVLYLVSIILKIKNKKLKYFDVFAAVMMLYFGVLCLGLRFGRVSLYYTFKIYFIIWMVTIGATIDVINEYIDLKAFKYIGPAYITVWCLFVCSWVWIKAGHVIGEEEKHALPNYVGIYYVENCEFRKQVDLTHDFTKENVEVTTFARENIPDLTADNLMLVTDGVYYTRIWATAMLEIDGSMPYQEFIQDNTIYSLKMALENDDINFLIRVDNNDAGHVPAYEQMISDIESNDNVEILFKNKTGIVAKINREVEE